MENKQSLKIVFRLPKPQQQQQPTPTSDQTQCSLHSNKKRKLSSANDDAAAAKKKVCIKKPTENRNLEWGYSTDLMLYDNPWKIKKTLTKTDLGDRWLRLLIPAHMAKNLILPVFGIKMDDATLTKEGFAVRIWDINTESEFKLNFKFWKTSGGYIFNRWWMEEFVQRRDLKVGDEIGFHWDPYKMRFDFSVLKRAATAVKDLEKKDLPSSEMMEWGSSLTL